MAITLQQQPKVCSNMAVYYRSFEKKIFGKPTTELHRINVDTTCPEEARSIVMEELHNTMEPFIKPILILVQGGKA